MDRWKKISIAAVIILFLLAAAGLIYLEFGENISENQQEPEGTESPIFPFASSSDFFNESDTNMTTTTDQTGQQEDRPNLWKISDDPVAGSRFVNDRNNNNGVWFIKKSSGNLFIADPQSRSVNQVATSSTQQVRNAYISSDGTVIIYQFLSENGDIQTYKTDVEEVENSDSQLKVTNGSFLPSNIYDADMSIDGDKLFYLRKTVTGKTVGVDYNLETNDRSRILNSEITEWRADYDQPDVITLHSPASDGLTGYAYHLDTESGRKTRLVDGTGLTVKTNESGNLSLITKDSGNQYTTRVLNLDSKETQLSIPTFSEKCTWQNASIFLCGVPSEKQPQSISSWYQGNISFVDNISVFNTESGDMNRLFTDEQIDKAKSDVVNIKIQKNFQDIIFKDKSTGDLWGYEMEI